MNLYYQNYLCFNSKPINIENRSTELAKIANLKSRLARDSFSKIRRKNILDLGDIILPKLRIAETTQESDQSESDEDK